MRRPGGPVQEEDLHAFVDGQLPPEGRARVEAFLKANPAAAAQVAAWREQNRALRTLFATDAEVDPAWGADLRELLRHHRQATSGLYRPVAAVAAGLLLLVGGVVGGAAWQKQASNGLTHFTQAAEQAYLAAVAGSPLQDVNAAGGGAAPDFTAFGWRLLGMSGASGGSTTVRHYEYGDRRGRRLVLLVGPPPTGSQLSYGYLRDGDRTIFTRLDERMSFALVGELSRAEMMKLAEQLQSRRGAVTTSRSARNHPPVIQSALDSRL